MFFIPYAYPRFAFSEFKNSDHVVVHELCGDWTTIQIRKFVSPNPEILINLSNIQFICSTFCLDREKMFLTIAINPNINLVRFHLSNPRQLCPHMVLKGKTCNTCKNIDDPVVTQFR